MCPSPGPLGLGKNTSLGEGTESLAWRWWTAGDRLFVLLWERSPAQPGGGHLLFSQSFWRTFDCFVCRRQWVRNRSLLALTFFPFWKSMILIWI